MKLDLPSLSLSQIPKQNAFTAIRIICAIIVVYEHLVVLLDLNIFSANIRNLAVETFFFLSGFWVTRSFFTSKNLLEFFKKRLRKIFPPYLIIIFACAILLVFLSTLDARSYFSDSGFWKYLAANITTLNFLHPDLPGVFDGHPVNGSLWTIKVELGFYIFLPLIIILCLGTHDKVSSVRILFVLMTIYFLSLAYVFAIPFFIEKYNLPFSLTYQLPACMRYFATGMFCFFFYDKIYSVLNYLVAPCFILLVLSVIFKNVNFVFYISSIFEPATLAIVVIWSALKARPLFIFSKIYDFSYYLYLFHYPIIMVVKELI